MPDRIEAVAGGITAAQGVLAAGVHCGIKRDRPDLALIVSETTATVAGTFTRNRVKAAPVQLCLQRIGRGRFSALVVNSGNANCCTGKAGLRNADAMARRAAEVLDRPPGEVFVASTGVIGKPLPMDAVGRGIRKAALRLGRTGGVDAARAILTTDTGPKEAAAAFAVGGRRVTVGGMAKGAGMIAPDMATMLCFLATDARVPAPLLRVALRRAVDGSFNRITVDGDTSTNDTTLCFATGSSGASLAPGRKGWPEFTEALGQVTRALARMIVRDGEGATKLVEVRVRRARSAAAARRAAVTVANSLLVKTALHAEDMNWGRIMAALGRAGVVQGPDRIGIELEDVAVVRKGVGLGPEAEARAHERMRQPEFALTIDLGAGRGQDAVWTCDLSAEYVRINAEYRS